MQLDDCRLLLRVVGIAVIGNVVMMPMMVMVKTPAVMTTMMVLVVSRRRVGREFLY